MYSFFNRLRGSVTLKISGAQPEAFINECVERGAELIFASPVENYCTVVTMPSRQLKRARRAAAASCCTAEILGRGGAASLGRLLLRRIVPAVCLALCLALLAWSKLFLWEIEVKGAERVSEGEILSALA
ncbi:MAG: sporulation protein YqfD, partial [Oscillospiraceae bacterium]|nr:sporulation protein YqfD [Oscillospiraceae bacterium]